jgi:hypothetical protein
MALSVSIPSASLTRFGAAHTNLVGVGNKDMLAKAHRNVQGLLRHILFVYPERSHRIHDKPDTNQISDEY